MYAFEACVYIGIAQGEWKHVCEHPWMKADRVINIKIEDKNSYMEHMSFLIWYIYIYIYKVFYFA